jgi:energy-coupling factor transporter ATP-binding protein EcfA2
LEKTATLTESLEVIPTPSPFEFSSFIFNIGERKRLAIGIDLILRPSVLFLDEPVRERERERERGRERERRERREKRYR